MKVYTVLLGSENLRAIEPAGISTLEICVLQWFLQLPKASSLQRQENMPQTQLILKRLGVMLF